MASPDHAKAERYAKFYAELSQVDGVDNPVFNLARAYLDLRARYIADGQRTVETIDALTAMDLEHEAHKKRLAELSALDDDVWAFAEEETTG